jgi:hypothetical protein
MSTLARKAPLDWGPYACEYPGCHARKDDRNGHASLCFVHSAPMDLLPPDEIERAFVEQRRREAALVLSDRAVDAAHTLVNLMDSEREDVQLRASLEVLDRTGLGKAPTVVIDASQTVNVSAGESIVAELHARLDRLAGRTVSGEVEAAS